MVASDENATQMSPNVYTTAQKNGHRTGGRALFV